MNRNNSQFERKRLLTSNLSYNARRAMATRWILLVAASLLLWSFSGVLFSTSLTLGKALESPGRTDHAALLRANDRYWQLFPFQLMVIAIVAGIVVSSIPNSQKPGRISRGMLRVLVFFPVMLALLVFNYLFGIVAFNGWGNALADYLNLKRP